MVRREGHLGSGTVNQMSRWVCATQVVKNSAYVAKACSQTLQNKAEKNWCLKACDKLETNVASPSQVLLNLWVLCSLINFFVG